MDDEAVRLFLNSGMFLNFLAQNGKLSLHKSQCVWKVFSVSSSFYTQQCLSRVFVSISLSIDKTNNAMGHNFRKMYVLNFSPNKTEFSEFLEFSQSKINGT